MGDEEAVGEFVPDEERDAGGPAYVPDLEALAKIKDFSRVKTFIERVEEDVAHVVGRDGSRPGTPPDGGIAGEPAEGNEVGDGEEPGATQEEGDGGKGEEGHSQGGGGGAGASFAAVMAGVGKFAMGKKRRKDDIKLQLDSSSYDEFASIFGPPKGSSKEKSPEEAAKARENFLLTWWATCRVQAHVKGWIQKARWAMVKKRKVHIPLDLRADMEHCGLDYEKTKAILDQVMAKEAEDNFDALFAPMTKDQRYVVARFAIEDPEIETPAVEKLLADVLEGKHVSQHHFITLLNIAMERKCIGHTALATLMTAASKTGWITDNMLEDMIYDGIKFGFDFKPHLAKLLRKAVGGGSLTSEAYTRVMLFAIERGLVSPEEAAQWARELVESGVLSAEAASAFCEIMDKHPDAGKRVSDGSDGHGVGAGPSSIYMMQYAGSQEPAAAAGLDGGELEGSDDGRHALLKNRITRTSGLCLGPVPKAAGQFVSPFLSPRHWQVTVAPGTRKSPRVAIPMSRLSPPSPPHLHPAYHHAIARDAEAEASLRRQIAELRQQVAPPPPLPRPLPPPLRHPAVEMPADHDLLAGESSMMLYAEHSLEGFPSVSATLRTGMYVAKRPPLSGSPGTGRGPRRPPHRDPAYGVAKREVRELRPRVAVRSHRNVEAPFDHPYDRRALRGAVMVEVEGGGAVRPPPLESARGRPLTKGGMLHGEDSMHSVSSSHRGGGGAGGMGGEPQVFTVHRGTPERAPSPPAYEAGEEEGGEVGTAATMLTAQSEGALPPRGRTAVTHSAMAMHTYSFRGHGLRTPGGGDSPAVRGAAVPESSGLIVRNAPVGEPVGWRVHQPGPRPNTGTGSGVLGLAPFVSRTPKLPGIRGPLIPSPRLEDLMNFSGAPPRTAGGRRPRAKAH